MKLSYDIEHTLAILIGTGNYQTNDFISIPPIKNNLQDLKNILLNKDIFGLPEERIVVLEDRTHIEILETLEESLSDVTLKTVFIYYSGHGHRTSKDRLYLTANNSKKAFHLIKASAIEFTDFKSIIENSPGKPNSIVIIDACYSGIATQSDNALTDEERTINGACIITSSSNKEQSFFDPNGKHTFFTDELIEILSNGSEKSDMLLSINDIYNTLQKQLRTKNISEPQRRDNLDTKVFYFAKNKKFNKEFFIRKAEEYFNRGNYFRALEYYYTLQEKFDDIGYSKQIEKCKNEIEYLTLIIEADGLYSNKKYEPALEKYNEAKKLKSDSSLLFKISNCENYVKMRKEFLEEQQREIEVGKRKEQEEQKRKQEDERQRKEKEELQLKEAEELRQKHEEELKRKQEEELKKKQEEELKRKQGEELKIKQEDEFKIKHEEELKIKQEEELKRKHEEDLKRKQEEDLKRKQEEELKKKQEDKLKRKQGEELKRKQKENEIKNIEKKERIGKEKIQLLKEEEKERVQKTQGKFQQENLRKESIGNEQEVLSRKKSLKDRIILGGCLLLLILVITLINLLSQKDPNNKSENTLVKLNSDLIKKDKNGTKVSLILKPKKGDVFKYKINAKTSSKEKSPLTDDKEITSTQDINYFYKEEVNNVASSGIVTYKVKFDSIEIISVASSSDSSLSMSYNSNIKDSIYSKPDFLQYNAIMNEEFFARVSPQGEILEIFGLEKIYKNMFTVLGNTLTLEQKDSLKFEDAIQAVLQQQFQMFPQTEVYKDSTWTRSYETQILIFPVKNILSYELKDVKEENNQLFVIIDAELAVDFIEKEIKDKKMSYKVEDVKTGGKGVITFNLSNGCVSTKSTNTDIDMNMKISAGGQSVKAFQSVSTELKVYLLQ